MVRKIFNLFKQYGIFIAFKRIFLATIRPLYRTKSDLILAISDHKPTLLEWEKNLITKQLLVHWLEKEEMSDKEIKIYSKFLDSNCKGYFVNDGNKLAAWGFVQTEGIYKYDKFTYYLSRNVCMLRNLYTKPKYRGKSYGKEINSIRINSIPTGYIPVVFVIPENRYAIRNLKMYGFEEILLVKHTIWFKRWEKREIQELKPGKTATTLLSGFENNS